MSESTTPNGRTTAEELAEHIAKPITPNEFPDRGPDGAGMFIDPQTKGSRDRQEKPGSFFSNWLRAEEKPDASTLAEPPKQEATPVQIEGENMPSPEAQQPLAEATKNNPEVQAVEQDAERLLLRLGEINDLPAEEAEKFLTEVKELFSRVSRVFTDTVPKSLIEFGALIAFRDPDLMKAFRKTAALTATFGISLAALAVNPELALTSAVIVGGAEATKRGWRRGFQGVGRFFSGIPQIVRGVGFGMRKIGSGMAVLGGGNRVYAPAEAGGIEGFGEAAVEAVVNIADAPLRAQEGARETARQNAIVERQNRLKALVATLISPDSGKGEMHRARVNAENILKELEILERGAEAADTLYTLFDFTVELIDECLDDGVVNSGERESIAIALANILGTATEEQKRLQAEKVRLEAKRRKADSLRDSIETRREEFKSGARPRWRVAGGGRGRDNWTEDYAQWRKDVQFVAQNKRNDEDEQ